MAVHPDGTGTGWTNVETVDVDQPHGKDYLFSLHIAKGVRKRINKEHVAFGDSTAGGEHVPGGCNVLDVVDSTADLTDGWNDGTYVGGGLVHETDKGRLWVCSTLDTTYDGATDVTLVKLQPDLQWAGQDVTWAGAHEFDASVDISGNVAMDGDLTIDGSLKVGTDFSLTGDMGMDGTANFGDDIALAGDASVAGKLIVDSSCDFSDVYVDGDISVKGSLDVATDLSVSGDVAVDGTTNLTGDVGIAGALAVDGSCDISDLYVDGDMSVKGSLDIATDLSVSGDVAVDGTTNFYDEVDFSSVNTSGIVGTLSAYTREDSEINNMLTAHAYLALTDGFVSADVVLNAAGDNFRGYVGATDDPAGAGDRVGNVEAARTNHNKCRNFLVAKGEYFEIVTSSGTPLIWWKSFGALGNPVDQD